MYMFSNYIFTAENGKDFSSFAEDAGKLFRIDNLEAEKVYEIEEDNVYYYTEVFYEIARNLADRYPDIKFKIEGTIDASSVAGEMKDFKVRYHDGEIEAKESEWYNIIYKNDYETYEDFAMECLDRDREPLLSEEEYEELDDEDEILYSLNSGDGPVVMEVPVIYDIENIPLLENNTINKERLMEYYNS